MNSFLSRFSVLAFALWALAPSFAQGQIQIGNTGEENTALLSAGDSSGTSIITAIGQTFTTPDTTNVGLSSIQVNLLAGTGTASIDPFIDSWNTSTNTTVSPVWIGTATAVTGGSSTPYVFNTGDIALDPTLTYVFGFSIDQPSESGPDATLGVSTTAALPLGYTGGNLVEYVTPAEGTALGFNTLSWAGSEWVNLDDNGLNSVASGLTFSAEFTPVPEASTYAIGSVLLCLGLVAYFHRKRRGAAGLAVVAAV